MFEFKSRQLEYCICDGLQTRFLGPYYFPVYFLYYLESDWLIEVLFNKCYKYNLQFHWECVGSVNLDLEASMDLFLFSLI